jgi:hypothetical protein
MNSHDNLIQIIFHYTNNQTESFNILLEEDDILTPPEIQQQILKHLEKPWCLLHLPEQTICVNTANLLKVEMKPPMLELQGEGVFTNVRRVTALSRTVQR